jgi:hypothetical protein
MPIVAIAGAVAGASSLIAGGLTAFQTISAIGGIVAGVGALTGEKDLMKIGAIAGLAGGVGAFAEGQGWIGGDSGTSNITALKNTPAPGMESQSNSYTPFEAGYEQTAGLQDAPNAAGSIASNIGQTSSLVSDTQGIPATPGLMDATEMNPTDQRLAFGTQKSPTFLPNSSKQTGVMDTLKGFFADKEMKSLAGNFIGGMFDGEKKAKTAYYEAQADAVKARTANGSAVPTMNFKVNPKADIFKPTSPTYNPVRPAGLMFAK